MANNKSPLKILGFGIAEIVGFLAIFAVILGVLNYLNILSLSQLYPQYFASLPHQPLSQSSLNLPSEKKLTFFCPAPIRPCNGQEVFKNNAFVGLGFKVDNGGPIFAAISGDLIYRDENATQSSVRDTAVIVGKSDKTKGYAAIYDFVGAKIGDELTRSVLAQDPVGTATNGSYLKNPQYRGINLIFRIHNPQGNILRLTPSDFE